MCVAITTSVMELDSYLATRGLSRESRSLGERSSRIISLCYRWRNRRPSSCYSERWDLIAFIKIQTIIFLKHKKKLLPFGSLLGKLLRFCYWMHVQLNSWNMSIFKPGVCSDGITSLDCHSRSNQPIQRDCRPRASCILLSCPLLHNCASHAPRTPDWSTECVRRRSAPSGTTRSPTNRKEEEDVCF